MGPSRGSICSLRTARRRLVAAALEIGLTTDVDAWHVAAAQAGVFVTGANELVSVDPESGVGRTVATGPWDYDYTDIDVSGNQVAVVSGRDMETFLADGSRLSQAEIKPGVGNLLHVGLDGRWLWVSTTNGLLARVDPGTGRIDHAMPANTGPLVVGDGYVFVGDLRVNSQTFADRRLPFWATGVTDSTLVGQHLWLVGDGWVRCADVQTLEACGDITIPAPSRSRVRGCISSCLPPRVPPIPTSTSGIPTTPRRSW